MVETIKTNIYNLLRWSEKWTKTDMVYLAGGGFWLGLGYGVQMILGVILMIAFANLLPKDIFGTYQFVISMSAIIAIFTLTGMGTAIMRATAQGVKGALRYGFKVKLTWSIGIVVVAGIYTLYYFLKGNQVLAISFLIVGVLQPFISSFELYKSYFLGKQYFRQDAWWSMAQKVIPFIVILPTIFLTNNPIFIVLAYFASHASSLFLAYLFTVKKYHLSSIDNPEVKNYGKHLSIMKVFLVLYDNMDKVLLWHFLGAVPVAVYTLAHMPVLHFKNISQLIRSLTFPKLAQKDVEELKIILPSKIKRYFLFVLLIVAIYILTAPIIFKVLFPLYPEAVLYSQVLALSILFVPRSLLSQVFTAHAMKKEQYIFYITVPIVKIISLLILLPFWGIWGIIVSIFISETYSVILQSYLLNKSHVKNC